MLLSTSLFVRLSWFYTDFNIFSHILVVGPPNPPSWKLIRNYKNGLLLFTLVQR